MTPPTIWCFLTKDGDIPATTSDKEEANGWVKHGKAGESVAEYALVKAVTKRKGDK